MSVSRRIGLALLVTGVCISVLELGASVAPSLPRFVSEAEAVVGRPLTPVSVAGVGRRTARRCAVGVYDC
jgi:hypothetical protein